MAPTAKPDSSPVKRESTESRSFQLPTATEVFNLRSKCAELGRKIAEYAFYNAYLNQTSRYDTHTNRCYVKLERGVKSRSGDVDRYVELFDGQTQELLVHYQWEHGPGGGTGGTIHVKNWEDMARSVGMDLQNGRWPNYNEGNELQRASNLNPGFIQALIEQAMADDRKQ